MPMPESSPPNGNGHAAPSQAERVKVKVNQAREQAGSVAEAVRDGLAERVAANPYGALAAAFAVGYVTGGGLFTKTTARVIQLGARLAMIPQVREPLLDLAEQAIDGMLDKTRPKGT
ncbi:MAG: hypothetical protein IPJ65_32940 [Archangiaceae bacterium]|nr:hypothetical protein [Archangiaceae bacterium]